MFILLSFCGLKALVALRCFCLFIIAGLLRSHEWLAMSAEERLVELRRGRVVDSLSLPGMDRLNSEAMLAEARSNLKASKKLAAG